MWRIRIGGWGIQTGCRPRSYATACAVAVLYLTLIPLACGTTTLAGPAAPVVFELEQPDGTRFQARIIGDEWDHWTETVGGYTVVRDEATGMWVYAVAGPDGALVAGSKPVGEVLPYESEQHLRPKRVVEPPPGTAANLVPGLSYAPPIQGIHNVVILVVDFTPSVLVGTSPAYWADALFGSSGSVADYFNEVTYGQIAISPAVETDTTAFGGGGGAVNDGVVYVQLGYAHPDTRGETGNKNRWIVHDAIVASDAIVTYSGFDVNHDSYISTDELHVVTVVAGCEFSYGIAGIPNVWAHQWSLGSWHDENENSVVDAGEYVPAPTVDGVVVGHSSGGASGTKGGYTQLGEWHGVSLNLGHAATIGIICHELGHDLGTGVPDLYDTDGSSIGIGSWCLQAGGGWNRTTYLGDTPAHWCAWAKWYLGLLTPTQITTDTNNVLFPRVEDATGTNRGVFQVLDNPLGVDFSWWGSSGTGEYFLLENRQRIGYDADLPGSGLCIWHIYEAAPTDNTNNNNEGSSPPGNPRLVVLEQMDGRFDLEGFGITGGVNWGDTTDPWVDPSKFDDTSTPNSRLYNGSSTWVSVTDISASGAMMTADVSLASPEPNTAAAFRVKSDGNVLMDQTLYSAALATGSADVAEWVKVSEPVEPGDVLELDPANPGTYRKARGPCSPYVAGIVSTEPGIVLGGRTAGMRAPLALVGFVPVKACDEGGPIRPGDLLVAASRPGYVRRRSSEDCGFIIGKALEPLIEGEGMILVLMTR